MVLKLPKIELLLRFFAGFSEKSFSAVYVYASESSPFALLEIGLGYYAMT